MSQTEPTDDGSDPELRCGACGYKWTYTGEMWRATCPRCGGKVETPYYGNTH